MLVPAGEVRLRRVRASTATLNSEKMDGAETFGDTGDVPAEVVSVGAGRSP
jgi:hypothetical protein